MQELPLFPLNTVLFPGMPLSLHIFEERYKQMIDLCLREKRPFGVVLIRQGREVGAPADPYPVGCMAHITHVHPLEDGRMNLLAIGRERFRTTKLRTDRPYLIGLVEALPVPALPERASRLIAPIRPFVEDYLAVLAEASETEFDLDQLPEDPLAFMYLSASLLQVPPRQRQLLLAIDDGHDLARALYETYRKEIAILRALLSPPDEGAIAIGPFSAN